MVGSTRCVWRTEEGVACELETAHLVEPMQVKQGDTLGIRKKLGFLAVLVTVGLMGITAFSRTTSGSGSQTMATPTVVGLSTASHSCTFGADNCNVTRCCAEPGMQCYEQNAGYAGCRATCVHGPDPTHFDSGKWSCKALGNRTDTDGTTSCADAGSDCRKSKCCRQPGFTCYEKDDYWAACKPSCFPKAPDFDDVDATPWTCKELGQPKSTAAWVSTECADSSDNCIKAGCCKTQGHQCYRQNDLWGTCMAECHAPWSCVKVGARTPVAAPPAATKRMPAWALDACSHGDCTKSRCCLGMDVQCYEKNEYYAKCLSRCVPGPHADDIDQKNWSCKVLGPRSWGTPERGFPSLYCFSVMRTEGYEVGLLKAQMAKGVGIFGCDGTSLLTADKSIHVGAFTTIAFPGAPVVVSVDNTAGNTWLFVKAWEAVIRKGLWLQHTFTLKADPDTVMIPDRMRSALLPYVHEKVYLVNCPLHDMMYGALEVFSYFAIKEWAIRRHQCATPNNWGEDKYMGACMDSLGVKRVNNVTILDDLRCGGHGCGNHTLAAFHPYKEVSKWVQCYLKTNPRPQPVAPRPQPSGSGYTPRAVTKMLARLGLTPID